MNKDLAVCEQQAAHCSPYRQCSRYQQGHRSQPQAAPPDTGTVGWKSHVRSDFRLRTAQHWSGAVMAIHERVKGEPHSPSWTHITFTHLSQTLAMFCDQLQNSC
ncbi:hypothetical protein E2C01_017637 [Portunus trituberculatus]|uniref:Uncharacterized protein n=1 Tax=Portunus trituberculatus TaxID=210409 RepID=A0A5B7DTF0_PORTR|nr:hypothetical protein [Portunus trituberculatus]